MRYCIISLGTDALASEWHRNGKHRDRQSDYRCEEGNSELDAAQSACSYARPVIGHHGNL